MQLLLLCEMQMGRSLVELKTLVSNLVPFVFFPLSIIFPEGFFLCVWGGEGVQSAETGNF